MAQIDAEKEVEGSSFSGFGGGFRAANAGHFGGKVEDMGGVAGRRK